MSKDINYSDILGASVKLGHAKLRDYVHYKCLAVSSLIWPIPDALCSVGVYTLKVSYEGDVYHTRTQIVHKGTKIIGISYFAERPLTNTFIYDTIIL